MKTLLKIIAAGLIVLSVGVSSAANADTYKVDDNTMGAHAFVQFRVKHLGYSWLYGSFESFSGNFFFDPKKPEKSWISMKVDMNSVNSNHAKRDKHIRSDDFLSTTKHPVASFESFSFSPTENGGTLTGDLTFFGAIKSIEAQVDTIGGGKDPWGGYRQGFEARATIKPADFGLDLVKKLGAAAAEVELIISVEGVKQPKK